MKDITFVYIFKHCSFCFYFVFCAFCCFFFFSSRRRHTRYIGDWSSDVCSSDLAAKGLRLLRSHALPSRAPPTLSTYRGAKSIIDKLYESPAAAIPGIFAAGYPRLRERGPKRCYRSEERRVGKEGRR